MSVARQTAACLPAFISLALSAIALAADEPANPFNAPVLDARPRIFIRADDKFDGLTVARLRKNARTGEFASAREKWRGKPLGRAILWMLDGKREDLDAAIAGLKRMDASGGSWSDRGPALMQMAALFDWLYPQLDDATRQAIIAKIEKAADDAVDHINKGQAPFFYSRTPGALAGVTLAGIALHGASPKADGYLRLFREWGVNDYLKAYQWVDGAATGATYTMNYTFVDLPSICAAWWSATGRNPADWIRKQEGDWLGGIVRFYLWYMRPGFAFTDINDQFREIWSTHDEFCQGLDIASYVMRDGYGRNWSGRWLARFGSALYHTEYAHNLIFRDPSLSPRPLTDLPDAELFGRESCGYGFFRSHWPADGQPDTATHVFFRCGDPMDVHGGVAAGEFQVFKHAPLADRSGKYGDYDSPADQYHRNCISANVVLFTDPSQPDDRGDQNTRRGLKTDHRTWQQWLEIRQRNGLDVASITEWEVRKDEAHCRADLTKANPPGKCKQWIRQFVWLANKHLVVLDIVESASPTVRYRWQLHCPTTPELSDHLIAITNKAPDRRWADDALRAKSPEARLFCQTILPRDYGVILHDGGAVRSLSADGQPAGKADGNPYHLKYGKKVIQLVPPAASTRTIFLNVLTAVEAHQAQPPKVACRQITPGLIDLTVDSATTRIAVPDWATVPNDRR